MTLRAEHESSTHQNNVRLVVVDSRSQPVYLARAAQLQAAMTAAAEALGVGPDDMPGLYGLCVEAIRAKERR
jgi:hypothetical protein